jgi:hypothetical protein
MGPRASALPFYRTPSNMPCMACPISTTGNDRKYLSLSPQEVLQGLRPPAALPLVFLIASSYIHPRVSGRPRFSQT